MINCYQTLAIVYNDLLCLSSLKKSKKKKKISDIRHKLLQKKTSITIKSLLIFILHSRLLYNLFCLLHYILTCTKKKICVKYNFVKLCVSAKFAIIVVVSI